MKLTLSWLKDHLEANATLDQITKTLTDLGHEVEGVEDPSTKLNGVVIAEVIAVERHPNADRLNVCQVKYGENEAIQVVCGASNVRLGMKVAFATVGTVIPATGQALKKGNIRSVDSFGMLCSATELLLGEDSEGILDLTTTYAPGTPFANALGFNDPVIDIALTPNRSDCFGIRGIARDLAAAGLGTLKPLNYSKIQGEFESSIQVEITDQKACPHFVGRVIKNVVNRASPELIQTRLKAIGQKVISALVDVTNYISIDLGRPLHVFDADKIQGNLQVHISKKGERLLALDQKEYELNDDMILISDSSGPLSLAGIMGGESTKCTEETVNVFVESALFDPIRTAQTGQALNILSDARTRFERGVDPSDVANGLEIATNLILQWCGGHPSHIVEAGHEIKKNQLVTLPFKKLADLSGCNDSSDVKSILEKLGFETQEQTADSLTVLAPTWRHDIEGAPDLVEEILRLRGYDAIVPVSLPVNSTLQQSESNRFTISIALKKLLASRGMNEAVTWTFLDNITAELFGGGQPSLTLSNPISQDFATMRPTLLPNLIKAAANNQARGQTGLRFFEIGTEFKIAKEAKAKPIEQNAVAGLRCGPISPRHWTGSGRAVDAFDAKADALAVLDLLGVSESSLQIEAVAPSYYHPGRSGSLKQGQRILAYFGEVHPEILEKMKATGPVVVFEVYSDLVNISQKRKKFLTLSPYQAVLRDFSFIVDQTVSSDQIVKAVQKIDKVLITNVDIVDVYTGSKLTLDKKSVSFQIRLQSLDRTLTEAEINSISDNIIASITQLFGGILRDGI